MKYICVVILFFMALVSVRGYGYNDQQFAQQFVNKHLGCILQRGPCDSTGRRIKGMLPYALDGEGCSLCNSKQRAMLGQVVRYMKRHHPYEWNRILQIYS